MRRGRAGQFAVKGRARPGIRSRSSPAHSWGRLDPAKRSGVASLFRLRAPRCPRKRRPRQMSISGTQRVDVGSQFGKYLLLKKLAAGGMGEIFLAKQQGPAGFEKLLVVKKVLGH